MPPYHVFPTFIITGSYLVSALLLIYASIGINWKMLRENTYLQHFFWGAIIAISGLMSMQAGLLAGLEFHLMGYTALTLLMGWRLALLVGVGVELGRFAFGLIDLNGLAYSYLFSCVLVVLFSSSMLRIIERYLPTNPFIYIMFAAFFTAGLSHAVSDGIKAVNLVLMDIYSMEQVWREYLRYLPLIMFPEGVINGMFISGMVAFNPRWLSSFDEDVYFR